MTVEFAVHPDVFDAFPGMRIVVAHAHGVDNLGDYPALRDEWIDTWQAVATAATHPNSQSHPRVRPWREAFRRLGVSGKKFPSSIEALLRRAMKGGPPFSINPLVDLYNTISLKHVVPAGAFDLDQLDGGLALRFTNTDDTFQALDEEIAAPVPAGEVAYIAGGIVLTRHFVWRQARKALIGPGTREAILVSEILAELPDETAFAVEADLRRGLETILNVKCRTACVGRNNPTVAW